VSFTLGDIENDVLRETGSQNPPARYGVGGVSSYPAWDATQGFPLLPQGLIDTAINNSVQKCISGLRWTDLVDFSYTFATNSMQYIYPFPGPSNAQGYFTVSGNPTPGISLSISIGGATKFYTTTDADTSAGILLGHLIEQINDFYPVTNNIVYPLCQKMGMLNAAQITARATGVAGNTVSLAVSSGSSSIVVGVSGAKLSGGISSNPTSMELRRLSYVPFGQNYRRDELAGIRLVSWEALSQETASGYSKAYSFSTEPYMISLTPDRKNLQFYPGPSSDGDLVTVHYVPTMTLSTGLGSPYLSLQTDVVPLPDDCRDLVLLGAMQWVWPVMQEFGKTAEVKQEFVAELNRIRYEWERGSSGDTQRMVDSDLARSSLA
jgi:hypothetical protein